MCFIFRLPPNSFTSLYHDNAEESLVKGSVHVEYVGLVFVGDRLHNYLFYILYVLCGVCVCMCCDMCVSVCLCVCLYLCMCVRVYVSRVCLHVACARVCVCVHVS